MVTSCHKHRPRHLYFLPFPSIVSTNNIRDNKEFFLPVSLLTSSRWFIYIGPTARYFSRIFAIRARNGTATATGGLANFWSNFPLFLSFFFSVYYLRARWSRRKEEKRRGERERAKKKSVSRGLLYSRFFLVPVFHFVYLPSRLACLHSRFVYLHYGFALLHFVHACWRSRWFTFLVLILHFGVVYPRSQACLFTPRFCLFTKLARVYRYFDERDLDFREVTWFVVILFPVTRVFAVIYYLFPLPPFFYFSPLFFLSFLVFLKFRCEWITRRRNERSRSVIPFEISRDLVGKIAKKRTTVGKTNFK